jgi:SPP1 gp7 family putative phage head morphogenesis protein
MSALRAMIKDPDALAEKWLAHSQLSSKSPASDSAASWLRVNASMNMQPLESALRITYGDGYVLGQDIAEELLTGDIGIDWSTWTAGNRAAATLLEEPRGLRNLLASQSITINSVKDTTYDRLGFILADTVGQGFTTKQTARAIIGELTNPSRALMIAVTETRRAVSAASMDSYQEAGVEKVEWLIAASETLCEKCSSNASAGPIPLNSEFPSGNTAPPAHPHCRCAISPVLDFESSPITQGRITSEGDYVAKPDLNDLTTDNAFNKKRLDTFDGDEDEAIKDKDGVKMLSMIYNKYGYHDKPLVSQTEFNRLADEGQPIVFRGVKGFKDPKGDRGGTITAQEAIEDFKTGDRHWAGEGIYGNGTYSSTKRARAIDYAGGNEDNVYTMVIRPEAKIIEYKDLNKMMEDEYEAIEARYEALKAELRQSAVVDPARPFDEPLSIKEGIRRLNDELDYALEALDMDESGYAVSRGYDMIMKRVNVAAYGEEQYYIILNRSAVVVEG